jgi:hypothetical protein
VIKATNEEAQDNQEAYVKHTGCRHNNAKRLDGEYDASMTFPGVASLQAIIVVRGPKSGFDSANSKQLRVRIRTNPLG